MSPPDAETVGALARLVSGVRPGQSVTTPTLRISVQRGAIGRPSGALLALIDHLDDPVAFAQLCTREPLLRALTYRRGANEWVGRRRWTPNERRGAVIDLSNLLWTFRRRSTGEPPRLVPVIVAVTWLREQGFERLIGVGDANLLTTAADREASGNLEHALDELVLAPTGVPADPIVLDRARDMDGLIVSNDMFRDWRRSSTWRRREIWRRLVPLRPHPDAPATDYDLGEPGRELLDPPDEDCP